MQLLLRGCVQMSVVGVRGVINQYEGLRNIKTLTVWLYNTVNLICSGVSCFMNDVR